MTFAYGRKSHAPVVLVDRDLSGRAKDRFVTDRPKTIRSGYPGATSSTAFRSASTRPTRTLTRLSATRL